MMWICFRDILFAALFNDNNVIAVLDVDSETLASFDKIDAFYLKEIIEPLMH